MLDWTILIVGATLFVAYANGANDNFKGVATLFGSGTMDYPKALWWATASTVAGSLAALFLATELISTFQGKGLVPSGLVQSRPFLTAVVLGTALTVLLATKIGIPVSTTHSLTGALLGSGFAAVGFRLGFDTLLSGFLLPLLLSPLVAVTLVMPALPVMRAALRLAGLTRESCVCIGNEVIPVAVTPEGYALSRSSGALRVIIDQEAHCVQRFTGAVWGINAQRLIDFGHFLSAGSVSFARGLNDTPKIVALGLAATTLDLSRSVGLVAFIMALGGLLGARKVAETVSHRITCIEPDEGFVANLTTSFLVIFASKWGLPVSTTHVSCGALFGIGLASGQAWSRVIRTVLLAWLLTLPVAALISGAIYAILSRLPVL